MAENYEYVVDRKENKQRDFAESETKHFVRSHDIAENAIFWTRDEGSPILGKIYYNAGNNCRSKEKREVLYAADE